MAVFDFSKAFDSVPHPRLLAKLDFYGICNSNLHWISSFLSARKQRVTLNGTQPSWHSVISGVPQGTVLGPLLFLLYINDIVTNISSEIRLFADDCIVYRTITYQSDCMALQADIDILLNQSNVWQMKFNPSKCHILSIGRQRNKAVLSYFLGLNLLTNVDSYPYLGVTVSSDLRWEKHINTIAAKATRTLNFVRRNVYCCDPDAKALAYLSLIRPLVEYGAAAWDPYRTRDIKWFNVMLHAVRNTITDAPHL